jgi:hypothetical protein
MLRKVLPMIFVSIALSVAMTLIVATIRTGSRTSILDRFMKRADLEPDLPDAEV